MHLWNIVFVGGFMWESEGFAQEDQGAIYTSIDRKDCLTIDTSEWGGEFEDYYSAECPGVGGYRVFISGGDLRYNLSLGYQGQLIEGYRLLQFHNMGAAKIEWRYARRKDTAQVAYKALIYRLSYPQMDSEKARELSMLVVMRLQGKKSCVIGIIEQQKDMNQKARALAQNTSIGCMEL